MMAAYSPSATTVWKKCPVLWQLTQQGVTRRDLGRRDLAAALGSGFAQAMHVANRCRHAGLPMDIEAAITAGQGWWQAQRQAWSDEGRRLGERDAAQEATLEGRLATLVRFVVTHDPIPPEWQVVAVEEPLGPLAGNARPDLVCQKPDGQLVVVDYKTTLSLGGTAADRQRRLELRMGEWRDSDQLYHYAWATGAQHVAIVLAVVEPKPSVALYDFWLPPEAVTAWAERQAAAWLMMSQHRSHPDTAWRAAVHQDQFGPCEMYDFCFGAAIERDHLYTVRQRGL